MKQSKLAHCRNPCHVRNSIPMDIGGILVIDELVLQEESIHDWKV